MLFEISELRCEHSAKSGRAGDDGKDQPKLPSECQASSPIPCLKSREGGLGNPASAGAEVGRSRGQGPPGQYSEFKASLSNLAKFRPQKRIV